MTQPHKAQEYLKVRIETAKPTELLLLLLDGAVRFATQAKKHIEDQNFEEKNRLLLRSQEILLELTQALDRKIGEELYGRLIGLYRFCYERLLEANVRNSTRAVDEALTILSHLRDTWRMAVERFEKSEEENQRPQPKTLCVEG